MSGVELVKLAKRFGAVSVINDLDLTVDEGSFVVLLGESGSGKSTILRMVAGLEQATGGNILIAGKDVTHTPPKHRDIAMVFQNYALYPHMNVAENMSFSLRLLKRPASEIQAKVSSAAKILNIEHLLARKPKELSGGQRQRVAIGRAIVREPQVFLFDEPLSNLDAKLRGHMRTELALLHERLGKTTVYVTHDQVEAMTLADRIVILDQGKIQQADTPANVFATPRNLFVAGFIGTPTMNFLSGKAARHAAGVTIEGRGFSISVPASRTAAIGADGKEYVVGIRPQTFGLDQDSSSGALAMNIDVVEYLGTESVLVGHLADNPEVKLTAVLQGNHHALQHKTVPLAFRAEDLHIFDAQTKLALA